MKITRIRLTLHARRDVATPSLAIRFKKLIRPHYPHAQISAVTVPFDHGFESVLDEAHSIADRAIAEQKRVHADLVAHLMPLTFTMEDSKTGGEDLAKIVLIAVAHEHGLGAFKVARAMPITRLPPRAAARLLEINEEVEVLMRPRTKHPEHEAAAQLVDWLAVIVTDDIGGN